MDQYLKQINHVNPYISLLKKMATLSFVAALQAFTSCVSSKDEEFTYSNKQLDYKSVELSPLCDRKVNIVNPDHSNESNAFNKLQQETVHTLCQYSPDLNGQTAFFKAIQKADYPSVKSLLKNKSITPKEVVKALMLALKYKDTLSFRYKHKAIVCFLLSACDLSPKDLSVRDDSGRTLLHLVIKRGDIDAEKWLVDKLPLEALCAEDNKDKTPMHLIACCKSKKMFRILFDRIYKLDPHKAIKELFKKDENEYSVIERSFLPKNRNVAALWNNSKIQFRTYFTKGREMFEFILQILPVRLNLAQLITIARGIENIAESGTIYKGYAATLRSVVKGYIDKEYGSDAGQVLKEVSHAKNLPAGQISPSITDQERRDYIKKESDSEVDEGYESH